MLCGVILAWVALMSASSGHAQSSCTANNTVCIVPLPYSTSEIEAHLGTSESAVWAEGDLLTFAYRGDAAAVQVCCGISETLTRVPGSDLWTLTARITDLAHAEIGFGFTRINLTGERRTSLYQIWRGSAAPPPVETSNPLIGTLYNYRLTSAAMGEPRDVTVYLPPDHDPELEYPVVYATDGQSTNVYAYVIEPLIRRGALPPTIIIGVHAGAGARRTMEYLPGRYDAFDAHEQFFTEEVRLWAEQTLGASTDRTRRAVFGFSNGAVFVATMGYRHPDLYAHILAFSLGVSPGEPPEFEADAPRFYLVAGTLEVPFYRSTLLTTSVLRNNDLDVTLHERVGGHDQAMWQSAFVPAVTWAFGG